MSHHRQLTTHESIAAKKNMSDELTQTWNGMSTQQQQSLQNSYLRDPEKFIKVHPKQYQMLLEVGLPRHVNIESGKFILNDWSL
jgi:hypothetical protein